MLKLNRALYKMNYVRKDRLKLLDVLANGDLLADIGVSDVAKLSSFYSKIAAAAPENVQLYEDFKRIFESVGFLDFVEKRGSFSDLEDVFTLFETAKSWSQANPSLTVAGFLKRIGYYRKYSLSLPSKRLSELPGRVKVLTAHQSKGLEYEAVFIPGISEGNWGGRRNVDQLRLPSGAVLKDGSASISADAEEEERRLFFVGITRAKAKLFLSYCESDGNKMKIASQFLTELGIEPSRNLEAVDYARVVAAELRPTALFASEMTEGEEAYVREFLQNYRLSPSDLSKFLEDPKLFLRDSIFKYPFEDNEYTVFGKTYHRALELFYLSWKKEGRAPGVESLLSDFERALKQEILPPEIREKLLKKGRE